MTDYPQYPPSGAMPSQPASRQRRRFTGRRHRDATPLAVKTTVVRRSSLYGTAALICFVAGVIEAFVALRIVFKALAANADAGFVQMVYQAAAPSITPFDGIFGNRGLSDGGVLESGAIIAFAVWALAAMLLVTLVRAATPSRSVA